MKQFLLAALVLMGAGALSAQVTADQLRIYINPGHGSWTSNDRPQQIVGKPAYSSSNTDTTGFFESNTNLYKGFGVLEKLIEMGFPFDRTLNQTGERWEIGAARDLSQNLVMSRVKNGPYSSENTGSSPNADAYNRSLSEIAAEVEYNEFDMFISIHSNAASTNSVNYHLYMYRGYNGQDGVLVDGSWEMIEAAYKYSFPNAHAQWSHDYVYVNGDIDFMGHGDGSYNGLGYYGYLGVLKHGVPGYLVEVYFHTHTPSRHRAMNWDVDILEGYQYARGVAEYFELEQRDETGEIYGIVRDAHAKFSDPVWIPVDGTDDINMPLNGMKVYLWKDGEKIDECTTDNFYNGVFVFKGLEPGTYQVTFDSPDYEPGSPVDVEVTAGLTSYPKCYLTDIYYQGRPGEELNYPNIVPEGTVAFQDSYNMYAAAVNREVAPLAGTTARRMQWMKGYIYVLAYDADNNPVIAVLDGKSGELLTTVNTDGCVGGMLSVGDIQLTGDGVLLASSQSLNQLDDDHVKDGQVRGTVNYYYWEKDEQGLPTGEPKLWFSHQDSGQWYTSYIGSSFAYTGTFNEGWICEGAISTGTTGQLRNTVYTVTDGKPELLDWQRIQQLYARDFSDRDVRYTVSPIDRHQFFVLGDGTKYGMRLYDFEHGNKAAYAQAPATLSKNCVSAGFFKFDGRALMTFVDETGALRLYDISGGIDALKEVPLTDAAFTAGSRHLSTGFATAITEGEAIVDGYFTLAVLADGNISIFTTREEASVADISVDNVAAPVRYFNLQGIEVSADALTPGIYIRQQGATAGKILIK